MTASWIINLKKLQDKDLRIRTLIQKVSMIPHEQIALKNQAAANRSKTENAKNTVLNLELQQKQAESKIAAYRENIQKLETQSNMVKKNNEYQSMLQQIADLKNKISDEETVIIELIDKIEEGKKIYRKTAEDVKYENASLKMEFLDLEKFMNDLKEEIKTLQTEREKLVLPIETNLLERYESLLKRNNGLPFAAIHDGICENCHLRVTPQTLNTAMKNQVAFCDNCQHIIYQED